MRSRSPASASSRIGPEHQRQLSSGHGLLAVLAQAVPLRDGDVLGHQREDLALLEVEVLQQRLAELLDGPGQLLAPDAGRLGGPRGSERLDLGGVLVDAVVLALHGLDERGRRCGPLQQQRPEQDVLAGVVHVQAGHDQPEVADDDLGAGGVTVAHLPHEHRQRRELAPEDAVDDHHLVDVGSGLGGVGVGGHLDLRGSVWELVAPASRGAAARPTHTAPTPTPHSAVHPDDACMPSATCGSPVSSSGTKQSSE